MNALNTADPYRTQPGIPMFRSTMATLQGVPVAVMFAPAPRPNPAPWSVAAPVDDPIILPRRSALASTAAALALALSVVGLLAAILGTVAGTATVGGSAATGVPVTPVTLPPAPSVEPAPTALPPPAPRRLGRAVTRATRPDVAEVRSRVGRYFRAVGPAPTFDEVLQR